MFKNPPASLFAGGFQSVGWTAYSNTALQEEVVCKAASLLQTGRDPFVVVKKNF